MTAQQVAENWGISWRRVQIFCSNGRIEGAIKMANLCLLPKVSTKPNDARKCKSGG